MISTLVAVLVAALCLAWSGQRLRAARRFDRDGAPELLSALGHGGRERAERVALQHAEEWTSVSVLREVLDAPTHAYGVALINEQLGDVRRDLDMGAELPRASARIALAAGTALTVLEIARGLPHGGLVLAWVAAPFVIGLVTALACTQVGRTAERHVVRHRDAWNGLRTAFTRYLPPEEAGQGSGQDP